MTKDIKQPDAYVREITDNTLSYVQGLQSEVSTLRDRILTLESDNEYLRKTYDQRDDTMLQQYTFIEQQHANLLNLYVAIYRLHETLDHEEVLSTIQEILANVVGSEEIAIFNIDSDGLRLNALRTSGLDTERFRNLTVGKGIIGRAISKGDILISGEDEMGKPDPNEEGLTACVPIHLNGKVTGIITVFNLLQQKSKLTRIDREVFEILATHAATAIHCARLHARYGSQDSLSTSSPVIRG